MLRSVVVNKMTSFEGAVKGGLVHKAIIDCYNTQSPLPGGVRMTYSYAWCAATVTAAYHAVGYDSIFPCECSCSRMLTKAKQMGIWVENDAYVPKPGDCILYDWQDSGVGDNVGAPDHVGMVKSVNGNKMTIIEGNMTSASKCGERVLSVNGKYIRGFITPKFGDGQNNQTSNTGTTVKQEIKATEAAKLKDITLAGIYKTTASLNLRSGAGISKTLLVQLPKDTKVVCYGYYSDDLRGVSWYYVTVTYKNIKYIGFCSSNYLERVSQLKNE